MADGNRRVADLIVDRLRAWRVPRVFGYPGDAIAGIVDAVDRAGGDPGFVRVRHEEAASFIATGHAKYTGGVGVCLANHGPGAVRLLPGLYDAKLDGQPVVAIVGEPAANPLRSAFQQGIEAASCSSTRAASSSRWRVPPRRCRSWWTGPSGPRWPPAAPPAWWCPTFCRRR